ncbi:MAG: NADH-quinone oxidoreductase subunit I [Chloroflexi bacterium]|nr:NADH-quinone oxidoreductase subunit I [Chloroflexota bacterium]
MKFEHFGTGIIKGLAVTLRHLFRKPITTQYPEQKLTTSRRARGNELVWDITKCTACGTCAKACPQGVIRIVTSAKPVENRYVVEKFEVDTGYCIFCGLCVEACPFQSLLMGYSYERAKYRRHEVVHTNEMLLPSAKRPASGYMYPKLAKALPPQTLLIERDEVKG